MPLTQTVYLDFRRLSHSGHSSIILRLMMAFNDIALANQSLAEWKREQPGIRKHLQMGARMYFVRLQCGHLNEAIEIIREVKNNGRLMVEVAKCSEQAQEAFQKLVACLDGPQGRKFRRYIGQIRNKTAFHYDPDMTLAALQDRASREEGRRSSMTRGDELALWRFEAADHIVDSIVSRQLWRIPSCLLYTSPSPRD